jgi:hypothetical protein
MQLYRKNAWAISIGGDKNPHIGKEKILEIRNACCIFETFYNLSVAGIILSNFRNLNLFQIKSIKML